MEKKRMNDKGFSLVELIIVIAIMAILIGILAPQYLKFVERSRKSTDVTNVSEMIRAMEIYVADPFAEEPFPGNFVVTIPAKNATPNSLVVATNSPNDFFEAALTDIGISEIKLKSSQWSADGTVYILIELLDNGAIKATHVTGNTVASAPVAAGDNNIVEGTYK